MFLSELENAYWEGIPSMVLRVRRRVLAFWKEDGEQGVILSNSSVLIDGGLLF